MNQNPDKTNESCEDEAADNAMPGEAIRVDENMIKGHLGKVVVGTVEQTLNALFDAEAGQPCKAGTLRAHRPARGYTRLDSAEIDILRELGHAFQIVDDILPTAISYNATRMAISLPRAVMLPRMPPKKPILLSGKFQFVLDKFIEHEQ